MPRTKVFVDAMPIAAERMSGIGHTVLELLVALTALPEFTDQYQLVLVSALRSQSLVKRHDLPGVQYRSIPLPGRIWNRLPATWLMPPMDLLLGKGLYLFMNFRCWPLLWSKSLTFIYDISYLRFPEATTARHQRMLARWVPRWARRSTLVAAISRFASSELESELKIPSSKLAYVPCGIDPAVFYERPVSEIESMRNRYGLPADYILYLGNIEPRKNLERLIRSYRALPAGIKQQHPLVLVGGAGWRSERITVEINLAREAGDTVVCPAKYVVDADLPALYSGASLLAHPALYEGFGIAPLQAMACGTPALAGDNSAMKEVVGDAAMLVDVTSEQDITDKMFTLLTDKDVRDRLKSAGDKRSHGYTWSASAARLLAAINRLVYADDDSNASEKHV